MFYLLHSFQTKKLNQVYKSQQRKSTTTCKKKIKSTKIRSKYFSRLQVRDNAFMMKSTQTSYKTQLRLLTLLLQELARR